MVIGKIGKQFTEKGSVGGTVNETVDNDDSREWTWTESKRTK